LIFLLEVDKSPMQITTLHWQGGCYWRKPLFHRENAFFLVFFVADLPLKIEKSPVKITVRLRCGGSRACSGDAAAPENCGQPPTLWFASRACICHRAGLMQHSR
jgi:hypothetical protein